MYSLTFKDALISANDHFKENKLSGRGTWGTERKKTAGGEGRGWERRQRWWEARQPSLGAHAGCPPALTPSVPGKPLLSPPRPAPVPTLASPAHPLLEPPTLGARP